MQIMENITIDLKSPCSNCGNKTFYKCNGCKRPTCGRCKTKKPMNLILRKIPAGLCKDCRELLTLFHTFGFAMDFATFFSNLPEKIDEWKKKYLQILKELSDVFTIVFFFVSIEKKDTEIKDYTRPRNQSTMEEFIEPQDIMTE